MQDNTNTFVGTVEDVANDPLQLGRVKVRVVNHHEELSVDDLQWMTVGTPTTSPSTNGIGTSPTWLLVGTTVYGMYFDGNARQVPIIMGTLPTIPDMDDSKHSVSTLARGIAHPTTSGPDVSGSPKYPFNKVITTGSGHIIEIDDTPGAPRIVARHSSGSYLAINVNGDVIAFSVNDAYHLASGDSKTEVGGKASVKAKTISLTADGDISVAAKGTCKISSTSKVTISAPSVSIA